MKFLLMICVFFHFYSCDFSLNRTLKDEWGNGNGDSSYDGGFQPVYPGDDVDNNDGSNDDSDDSGNTGNGSNGGSGSGDSGNGSNGGSGSGDSGNGSNGGSGSGDSGNGSNGGSGSGDSGNGSNGGSGSGDSGNGSNGGSGSGNSGNGSNGGSGSGDSGNGSNGGSGSGSNGDSGNSGNGSNGGSGSGNSDNGSNGGSSSEEEEGEDANLSCHGDNALSSGLKAKIYALKNKYINRKSGSASIKSILMRHKLVYIEDFIADKIDVEPRNYSLGVVGREGSYIVDPRTNLELLENYVIKYEGYISVQDEPEEGRYEFALLSDDGVLLKIGRRHMISTKKDMSPTLNCSRRTIYLKKNRPVKLRLFYHQGPRNKVSNTLLWRKVEKNCHVTSSRSSCGKKLNSISSLLSEGWSVVPQHVLKHKRKECLRVKTHCKIAK
ncbi:MAG: PA14 domain-containing protein [Bacteriovoracaceae bacterium]|nr:PA14 domain-containing protein [Bacteriovoracaceae bacterium]